jgi:dUTP pyrophosphatase
MDLHAAVDGPVVIDPGRISLVGCGFAMALPDGYEAQVRPRSGLASKHGLTVVNTPGTIDADYRGEVKVALVNLGLAPVTIERGMRIAQLVVAPVSRVAWEPVAELSGTARGSGGFGSTGSSG